MLAGKVITVGVTGGIAAYKAVQLVSDLKSAGAEPYVIMTRSAQEFIRPLTFNVLSGRPVYLDLFDRTGLETVQHIELAAQSELIVVVPATANILGKVAGGIADDLLSTVIMAATCPVLFCPAMNVNMYMNRVVQRNISALKDLGYYFVDPGEGKLACGARGRGRLAELDEVMGMIKGILAPGGEMRDLTVMVTAGPTLEPIDPVRYLGNRSSGKMGYAVAYAARQRGARVILISGPTALKPPQGVEFIVVETACQMYDAVMEYFDSVDLVVKSAAVADYRPKNVSSHKIKKHGHQLTLELERNPDILAELGKRKNRQILVGFAAETKDVEDNARIKVKDKNLDLLVANDVTQAGAGFGVDTNKVSLVYPDGRVEPLLLMSKLELAHRILDQAVATRNKR